MIERNVISHNDKNITNEKYCPYFRSLRLKPECLLNLGKISKVVFIGSSATGKTYIQRAVTTASEIDSVLSGKISVPRRIVTRPLRPDDGEEIIYSTPEELAKKAKDKTLGFYGVKTMEGGRTEPFGLEKPEKGKLPIFFINNVIVKNPQVIQPRSFLKDALIVGMYTPDKQREMRLRKRSPELFENNGREAKYRLSEEESSRIVIRASHVIVKNFGDFENSVEEDVIKLLQLILSSKKKLLI